MFHTVGCFKKKCSTILSSKLFSSRDSLYVFFAVTIASNYRISKYPTLKLFRNGQVVKKEYRGQRSVDAIVSFIRDELKDPVIEHANLDEMDELEVCSHAIDRGHLIF